MATERQKKLAKELIENQKRDKPDNITTLTEKVGYSKETARTKQKRTVEAKGTKEALKELGFDEESAKSYIKKVLNNPDSQKVGLDAVKEIFKVCGSYAPEKHKVEQEIEITDNELHEEDKELLREYKQRFRENIIKRAKEQK